MDNSERQSKHKKGDKVEKKNLLIICIVEHVQVNHYHVENCSTVTIIKCKL